MYREAINITFLEFFNLLLLFISIFVLAIGLYCLNKAHNIKIEKSKEINKQLEEKKKIQKELLILSSKRVKLLEEIQKEKQKNEEIYEKEKNKISEQLEIYKKNTNYASEQYCYYLEKKYQEIEKEYDEKISKLELEKQSVDAELNKLKESLSAGVQAQLREREKNESLDFYKLKVNSNDLSDIQALNQIKTVLHQPVILSKLIWTTYFQKQTTEMCNRILGTSPVCGIYKITNLNTQQCYIGQSVNIQDRWKQHIKCGLGIDASATNKLYKAMQEDGVWSFTFELLEKCPRNQLNEKEKFWIEMFQADIYSYNSTKGNK